MLVSTSLIIIGVSFPLVALSAPINCPPGAPCIPIPWREDHPTVEKRSSVVDLEVVGRDNASPKPEPGPTFPDPPVHQGEEKRQATTKTWPYYGYPVQKGPVKIERSAESEINQPERRQAPTKTWPYYGYPVEPPVKIERSADPEPNLLDDAASQPEKRQTNEPPTWPYHPPVPPTKHQERSADSEVDQPEKRQATTKTWPYYGYPVQKGPVKIERSASPEPVEDGPHEPEIPPPHYVYNDKRSAEPEADPEPLEAKRGDPPHPPTYPYSDPAPQKREADAPPKKPTGPGGPPYYLYKDPEKRATGTDDEEAPTSSPTATETATPYYGYRVPEKREAAPESTATESATPYYGYRVPEKRSVESETSEAAATATPYYGYRVPEKREEKPEPSATATPYYGYRAPDS
jgi:hypothetical protein